MTRDLEVAKRHLVEAEQEYQRARTSEYVARFVRDAAIVEAHRCGMSSREIGALVGDMSQPNVVRARRRVIERGDELSEGMLSPGDAVRASELTPREFIAAVREGRIAPVEVGPGLRAFRPADVAALKRAFHAYR